MGMRIAKIASAPLRPPSCGPSATRTMRCARPPPVPSSPVYSVVSRKDHTGTAAVAPKQAKFQAPMGPWMKSVWFVAAEAMLASAPARLPPGAQGRLELRLLRRHRGRPRVVLPRQGR